MLLFIIIYIYEASKISTPNEKNRGNEIATERMEYIQKQLKAKMGLIAIGMDMEGTHFLNYSTL